MLFSPYRIGSITLKNRFVASATVECLVSEDNRIIEKYLKVYERLSQKGIKAKPKGTWVCLS
jgi:2,4-dienoyl-CoA reductase-like NADH-dependent reductase (Old Yellow Enzyme family)